jgi:putative flavoprotein involved in K+ transport
MASMPQEITDAAARPAPSAALAAVRGDCRRRRHYSLLLALQLKARMEGIETPVYNLAEVHHTS